MDNEPRIFCADIGTSSVKAGIITLEGKLLWSHREPMLEQDNDLTSWSADRWEKALSNCFIHAGNLTYDGIVLSGNGPTLVPLNRQGKPTAPVLLWIDGHFSKLPDTNSFFLPKIKWFQDHNPKSFELTTSYLSCPEYLSYLLTGELITITPTQEFTPFIWNLEEISTYGFDQDHFPKTISSGSLIGRVSSSGSNTFGVPHGIPVYSGGSDFIMSLIGTGVVEPGMVCDRAGTSEGINFCSSRQIKDPFLRTLPHGIPGFYNVAGILSSTGRMFEWFRRISGQEQMDYTSMIQRIVDTPPLEQQPYFFPSAHQAERFEFNSAVFSNLCPSHGAIEMGRAVLESIGFTIRQVVEILHNNNCRFDSLRACGGQAKNEPWNQMKADILQKVIEVPTIVDAELAGCAIYGFVGRGDFSDPRQGCLEMVKLSKRYYPDTQKMDYYDNRFIEYENAFFNLMKP
jgi:xylulokinase